MLANCLEMLVPGANRWTRHSMVAREMQHPRRATNRRGSRTCVCANTGSGGGTRRERGSEKHVVPWYRPVGVVSTCRETEGGKARLPARESGHHAQVTGKAGENGRKSGDGAALILDKTVGSRVW